MARSGFPITDATRKPTNELSAILTVLLELTVTKVEDDARREWCKALAVKLGGDPDVMFFGASG